MGIFEKKVKFISAVCPECNGHLELDSNLETAFCQYCGAQCIVANAPKKAKKQNKLETVLGFIERQQDLRRQDKREKQRRADEEKKKQQEHLKKTWWIYLAVLVGIFLLSATLGILGDKGII